MHISDLDFDLPDHLVAQHPAARREASRLLTLDRRTGQLHHGTFADLVDHLRADDVLVLNETRVVAARLRGIKDRTGGKVEFLLLQREPEGTWLALARPLRGLQSGDSIRLHPGDFELTIVERVGDRVRIDIPRSDREPEDPTGFVSVGALLQNAGDVPLPPYIRRSAEPSDRERYQTVFARDPGSIAAPTAGLHFTDAMLEQIQSRGTAVCRLVLHVGPGTFEPIRADDPREHQLQAEFYRLDEETAQTIVERRQAGGRCIAVGTTTTRALETCSADGELRPSSGWTDLLISPPYSFRTVDALVTNFHLPRSSLLMLVSALAGSEQLRTAYDTAIRDGYRFYSYGDAMFIH